MIIKKIQEYLDNKEKNQYNNMIDFTKISKNLSNDDIKKLCKTAEENNFYSVCILPDFVASAHSFLSTTKISTLIDFPKGQSKTKEKISEIDKAFINGTDEIDVVINYNLIKDSEEHKKLEEEIKNLSQYCHKEGKIIKTIIEIGALNYQEIEEICRMCSDANVDYVMTSTGKLPNDNSFESKLDKVKYMRKILPNETSIKFSGGIRNYNQIKDILPFVDRIGTSSIIF